MKRDFTLKRSALAWESSTMDAARRGATPAGVAAGFD
jgi:hypothetical protein